jgi:vacuolar-type H+-ATPase subunit I/STV1
MTARLLFCDYDGEFLFADVLSTLGYAVDQIRSDGLRGVTVGEHSVYIFSFEKPENTPKVLKICEKLKSAELLTPIVLLARNNARPEFLNHRSSEQAADAYITNCSSEAKLLDVLDELIGLPSSPLIGKPLFVNEEATELTKKIEDYEIKLQELEKQVESQKGQASSIDKALEAQRNYYQPKLKAMLEGEKLRVQSETEQLKYRLSEVEAKLLEREAKIKELEQAKGNQAGKLKKVNESHQKAQESLRVFYQQKIRQLNKRLQGISGTAKPEGSEESEEFGRTTDIMERPKNI